MVKLPPLQPLVVFGSRNRAVQRILLRGRLHEPCLPCFRLGGLAGFYTHPGSLSGPSHGLVGPSKDRVAKRPGRRLSGQHAAPNPSAWVRDRHGYGNSASWDSRCRNLRAVPLPTRLSGHCTGRRRWHLSLRHKRPAGTSRHAPVSEGGLPRIHSEATRNFSSEREGDPHWGTPVAARQSAQVNALMPLNSVRTCFRHKESASLPRKVQCWIDRELEQRRRHDATNHRRRDPLHYVGTGTD